MEKYTPGLLDLAPRDIVARAIISEIRAGRGIIGDKSIDDYVYLDATHLGRGVIETKLPDIAEFCRTYIHVDPAEDKIPVMPTAHYAMGGIPTDSDGRVRMDTDGKFYKGLYAAGECACVSVHGANRLGTNSLVDLVVFGRRAGIHMRHFLQETGDVSLSPGQDQPIREFINKLLKKKGKMSAKILREKMEAVMMEMAGIYRTEAGLEEAHTTISELRENWNQVSFQYPGAAFNTELTDLFELRNLMDLALIMTHSARDRKESRGSHFREDFPERDDSNWLKHSFCWLKNNKIFIKYRPVEITRWKPEPRKY